MTDTLFRDPARRGASLELREWLGGVVVLGFVNAEYIRLSRTIEQHGWIDSVYGTFGISVIVWIAVAAILNLLWRAEPVRASKADVAVLAAATLLFFVPVTALSGVGLSLLGVYFSLWGRTRRLRRAMRIQTATTVALLWGRFSFSFLLPYILPADAALVSLLTGLERHGNLIMAADHATIVQVGAGCSSFLNLTIATLGWAVAIIYYDVAVTPRRLLLLLGSCLTILAINTLRIGLIGWRPEYYDLIHGYVGANIVNLISSASILLFSHAATRDEAKGRGVALV